MLQKHKEHENNEFIPIEQTFPLNDDALITFAPRNSIIPTTNFKGKQSVASFKLSITFLIGCITFVCSYNESAEGVKNF